MFNDWFCTITLYNAQALEASMVRTGEGRFQINFKYRVQKWRLDGQGTEQAVIPDDWLDVAVYDEEGRHLRREQLHVTSADGTLPLELTARPSRVVIDPDCFLLDRNPDDNAVRVIE